MPATIVTGNVSTEEVAVDEKKLDFDERFKRLQPDETQYTTMTSRATSRAAVREKFSWVEEDLFPRIITVQTAVADAVTKVIPLAAGDGKVVQPNDLLRNMRTGEGLRIESIATDTITATRGVGAGTNPAANINAGDKMLVVADAQAQGADFPVPRYVQRVLGYNYTEIIRTPWAFTGTATAIDYYGGREPAKEGVRKAIEHKRKIEATGFWGMRSFLAAVAPENEPLGTTGGLIEFITTNRLDSAGALNQDAFDTLMTAVFQYGTSDKVLFASPLLASNMSKWNRVGMGSQFAGPENGSVYGVKVNAFISGAYGYRIPVVVKTEFGQFPTANKGYGGYGFLVDMNYVERRPLRDRDTKLLTDRQPRGKDTVAQEYLTEMGWQVANEKAHAIIYGVV